MSAIGTSYAAGVAQTAHAAQQVGRQRDKAGNDRATDQAEFSKLMAQRLEAPEDAEDPDAELPDRQAPGYERLYEMPDASKPTPNPEKPSGANDAQEELPGVADFHHIDVQA